MQVCELAAMILEYFNVELYLVRYLHYSVFCGHFYTILSITCVAGPGIRGRQLGTGNVLELP